MEESYKCVPSRYVRVVTVLMSIFLLVFTVPVSLHLYRCPISLNSGLMGAMLLFVWGICLWTGSYAPRSVSLSDEALTFRCLVRKEVFRYERIDYIKKGHKPEGVRRFGSNGFLGYIGIIDADKMYHTRFNHPKEIIELPHCHRVYLLSCENSAEVIGKVNAILARRGG